MKTDLKTVPVIERPHVEPPTDRRFGRLIVWLIVLFGAAFGALLLLTTGEDESGETVEVVNEDTGLEETVEITILSQQEVVEALLRTEETSDMVLEVLYTPDWYFDWSARPLPDVTEDSLGFMIFETIHAGELTDELPLVTVFGVGGTATAEPEIVTTSSHHRVTRVFIPNADATGNALFNPDRGSMRVGVVAQTMDAQYSWELPMPNGLGVIDAPDTGIVIDPDTDTDDDGGLFGTGTLTMGAIAAIFAGMLTALSPCLLFLAVYYSAVLSGVTVSDEKATAKAKRKLFTTAAAFVGGFTVIYTLGGVGAGFIGASPASLCSTWGSEPRRRPMSPWSASFRWSAASRARAGSGRY
jgi:hypothetical protein